MLWDYVKGLSFAVRATVVTLVAILIVALVGIFAFGWLQRSTADYRGKTDQIEQINGNGSYRIAAYDHFFDLCASVQSTEQGIAALQAEKDGTNPSVQRLTVIDTSITALRIKRGELIAQYNADARKAGTAGQFRASDLPSQLSTEAKETSCTAN